MKVSVNKGLNSFGFLTEDWLFRHLNNFFKVLLISLRQRSSVNGILRAVIFVTENELLATPSFLDFTNNFRVVFLNAFGNLFQMFAILTRI